ncbi:MAG: hypothetical protein P4L43_15480 [Syntrophobacteraceae bacterium]|nr:hypothetical protein [Syntrophobacteraceae bacterium]
MAKFFSACILSALLFSPVCGRADSYYSNGRVENTCGTMSHVLYFKHFNITPDGYITGYVVNESSRAMKGLVIDLYTMDDDETRVFWQTILHIGEMAPKGRYEVKLPYSPAPDDPNKIVFRLKIHGSDEYRIPEIRK